MANGCDLTYVLNECEQAMDIDVDKLAAELDAMMPEDDEEEQYSPSFEIEAWRSVSPIYDAIMATQDSSFGSDGSEMDCDSPSPSGAPLPSLSSVLRGHTSESPQTIFDMASLERSAGAYVH